MRNVKTASIPTNRADPCDCQGGWFYVNGKSIDIITDAGDIVRITRNQTVAALNLMVRRRRA